MTRTNRIIAVLILMTLFSTAATVYRFRAEAMGHAPAVKVAEKEGGGRFLTDREGMTLYRFTKDSTGMSVCRGFCLKRWPIFHAEVTVAPKGIDVGDFDVITRDDGKKQSTYKGSPLYYFSEDSSPGDAKGQGVGDVWHVVEP